MSDRASDFFSIHFEDAGRTARSPADPAYPDGMDVDFASVLPTGTPACTVPLPYPAPRCGVLMIQCHVCGYTCGVTVAGRRDDPRTVTMPCRKVTKQ
jgi:hypothetical protein